MSLAYSPTRWFHAALDLVWPPWCPGCRQLVSERCTLCPHCDLELHWVRPPYCALCGDTLAGERGVCKRCSDQDPAFRGGRSGLHYEGVVRQVVLAWKYDGVRYYEPLIRSWMRTFLRGLPEQRYVSLDAVIPVPLHPRRLHWRGFNQSTILAEVTAMMWELPVWHGALLRTRCTPPQQRSQDRGSRERNLQGAFLVPDRALVRGRRLVLIDDVATTGSTLQACASALRDAGASSVTFLTLARQARRQVRGMAPLPELPAGEPG